MTKEEFCLSFKKRNRAPFLFIGSGFSRHYINTLTWEDLLAKFAPHPINKYHASIPGCDLPAIASAIAKELNEDFWNKKSDDSEMLKYGSNIMSESSYFKFKISEYFKEKSTEAIPVQFEDEINLLKSLNIEGIITTNWDDLAERFFPEYKTYIGQQDLLFSSTQGIGEIYKIHGCYSDPESMVLTKEDYDNYNSRNAYLAAKLLTIFVDYPVVFMGYSLADNNIVSLLKTIVNILDASNLQKLQNNLIFVDWKSDPNFPFTIEYHTYTIDNKVLPITRISTYSYKSVYECLGVYERTIPVSVLRRYKSKFCEIIVSEHPETNLCVLPESKLDENEEIQFVCGFGAYEKYKDSVGYSSISVNDIFKDIVDNKNYDAESILTYSIPEKRNSVEREYFPYFKYLKELNITSSQELNERNITIRKYRIEDFWRYESFTLEEKELTVTEAIERYDHADNLWKAVKLIPYLDVRESDMPIIKRFIRENFNNFINNKNKLKTDMRVLICFYDWKLHDGEVFNN